MFKLRFIIYCICFLIFLHFGLYFFDIDMFEFFEKPTVETNFEISKSVSPNEIIDTINELEQSIQELKDVSNI